MPTVSPLSGAGESLPTVEVRRSARRRRTVSAYREGDRVVVLIPQTFTKAQEAEYVRMMVERVNASEARRQRRSSPDERDLCERAEKLRRRYLPEVTPPLSVRWVAPMRTRWASCTPVERSIRLSRRLQSMPSWVSDYVLVHELAHLWVPGHGKDFWELVGRYPQTERARAYLDGWSAGANVTMSEDFSDDSGT